MNIITLPTSPLEAFQLAEARGVLPSALSSAEQRQVFTQALRETSVFSARTTNARYLEILRNVIASIAQGELNQSEARVVLTEALNALGFTPEGGFPSDADTPVPPAVEGTLQDLRSFRRQELILNTQLELLRGAGQKTRGEEPAALRSFPAWELVRVLPRAEPRDWPERFTQVGGELTDGRMIAVKGDPVWAELGASDNFDDALDVDHPPFAFTSGMRFRAVSRDELDELGFDEIEVDGEETTLGAILESIPRPTAAASGLSADFVDRLKADLAIEEGANGALTAPGILSDALERSGS